MTKWSYLWHQNDINSHCRSKLVISCKNVLVASVENPRWPPLNNVFGQISMINIIQMINTFHKYNTLIKWYTCIKSTHTGVHSQRKKLAFTDKTMQA
jgi:hypothetical protein